MGINIKFVFVSMATFLCVLNSNLELVAAEVTAAAYGYSHIQMLSGKEYSFNGKGEYLYLGVKEENLTVQIRTDYVIPSNKDITMITAVAMQTAASCVVETVLNRSSNVVDVYVDGIYTTSSDQPPHGPPPKCGQSMYVIIRDGIVGWFSTGGQTSVHQVKVSVQMSAIKVEVDTTNAIDTVTTDGLAGSEMGRYLIYRDSSLNVTITSTEQEIYPFTQSWSLQTPSESLFNYNISGESFTTINNHARPARFLEDMANDTHDLFAAYAGLNLTAVTSVCKGNSKDVDSQCMASIAVDGNISRGEEYMAVVGQAKYNKKYDADKSPEFTNNKPAVINVTIGDVFTLDLRNVSNDTDTAIIDLKYNVTTTPTLNYTLDKGMFTWYVGAEGRNNTLSMTFTVLDDYHRNGPPYTPVILYCGCQLKSQCPNSGLETPGGTCKSKLDLFERVQCDCGTHFKGTFCQETVYRCLTPVCFENVTCDSSKPGDNPCGDCPAGMKGTGLTCADLDECQLMPNSPCDFCNSIQGETSCSYCKNTDRSFTCSCPLGYTLNNADPQKQTCDDIDECANGKKCGINAFCRNTIGSVRCECRPGYMDKEGICTEADGYSYVGVLVLTITSTGVDTANVDTVDNRHDLANELTPLFNSTPGFLYVEVTKITIITNTNSRVKREEGTKCNIEYIVHKKNITSSTELQKQMDRVIAASTIHTLTIGRLNAIMADASLTIYSDALCNITDHIDCDPVSTDCVAGNGSFSCVCKPGFKLSRSDKYCIDIDECESDASSMAARCVHGECTNTPGSWNCTCPPGRVWTSVDNATLPIYICQDIDECVTDIAHMADWCLHGECSNMDGSWNCTCPAGRAWTSVGSRQVPRYRCEDIDECVTDESSMAARCVHGECTNTPGAWNCSCPLGRVWKSVGTANIPRYRCEGNFQYVGQMRFPWINHPVTNDSISRLVKQKVSQTITNSTATINGSIRVSELFVDSDIISFTKLANNTDVSAKFILRMGEHVTTAKLTDILNASSNNTIGGISIHLWNTVIFPDSDNELCKVPGRTDCDVVSTECRVRTGTYYCDCRAGYQKRSPLDEYCSDVDECESPSNHICHNGGTCVNTVGNWSCDCSHGHEVNWLSEFNITCQDIDECNNTNYVCDHGNNGRCTNTIGNWTCECNTGFRRRTINEYTYICEDINECTNDSYSCTGKGQCHNTPGSWSCTCDPGYTNHSNGEKHVTCDDIDECAETFACLESTGSCDNTPGSWRCFCREGLTPKQINSTSQICGGDYQYVAVMDITVIGGVYDVIAVKAALRSKITDLYQNLSKTVYIEIISIKDIKQSVTKRGTGFSKDMEVKFVIHVNHYVSENGIRSIWDLYNNDSCQSGCKEVAEYNGIRLRYIDSYLPTNEDTHDGLCSIPSKDLCHTSSAVCEVQNGTTGCRCRQGFTKATDYQCDDIDECQDKTTYLCNGGRCRNTLGNWECACNTGFRADTNDYSSTNRKCIDLCENPKCSKGSTCEHVNNSDGYRCHCAEGKDGTHCEKKKDDEETSKLKTIIAGVGGGAGGLIVVLILVIIGISVYNRRRARARKDEARFIKSRDRGGSFISPFPRSPGDLHSSMDEEDVNMRPNDPRPDYDKGNSYSGKTAAHLIPRARPISIGASSAMGNGFDGDDRNIPLRQIANPLYSKPHKPGSHDRMSYM